MDKFDRLPKKNTALVRQFHEGPVLDNGDTSDSFAVTNGVKQVVFSPPPLHTSGWCSRTYFTMLHNIMMKASHSDTGQMEECSIHCPKQNLIFRSVVQPADDSKQTQRSMCGHTESTSLLRTALSTATLKRKRNSA